MKETHIAFFNDIGNLVYIESRQALRDAWENWKQDEMAKKYDWEEVNSGQEILDHLITKRNQHRKLRKVISAIATNKVNL